MNAIPTEHPQQPEPIAPARPALAPAPLLRTLVVCDLVDSTALVQQLGDRGAAEFMHQLDRHSRDLLYLHGGREIDKTDGFLLLFERPIQAVAFALEYQRQLRELGQTEFLPLRARIGIHVGDVVLWENRADDIARGAKPVELEGLVKSVAARLMSLALPGQILLSGIAHTLAHRAQGELPAGQPLQWRAHGRYLFKGVAEPVAVYEVGESGIAPLARPAYSGKAYREVPWWRRPGVLALELAILIAAIATPAYFALRSPPAIAFANRDWVVVGDLKNLTNQTILNESLENAFRLGLEQSPYINVLSELKTRDTVALMQRDPVKTPVDRVIGSEVAIRDGARALILPTVAEVGGRVRVTAEVIDPKTQTTVYTETVDGNGINSVLPSIDTIDKNLRRRLGEALASVSEQSKPLDHVATGNLDALRAYALGQHAYFTGNMKDAMAYYLDAVKLDPQFATAHLVIARVLLNAGRNSAALKEIELALIAPNRLSARDGLLADAWQATLIAPSSRMQKWKLLTHLYPDFYLANGPYSYYAWCANDYTDAIAAAKLNIPPQNANRGAGVYLLGILYLADERYAESAKNFQLAADAGIARNDYYALVYAAQRQFNRTDELLKRSKPSGIPTDDLGTQLIRVAVIADQGRWRDAEILLNAAKHEADGMDALIQQRVLGVELSLRSEFDNVPPQELMQFVDAGLKNKVDNALDAEQSRFQSLFAIYLLAHNGQIKSAIKLLGEIEHVSPQTDEPVLRNLSLVVKAELLRAGGQSAQATGLLQPLINGHELFVTHVALLDAYVSNREKPQALDQARWLAKHRGRAYAEYGFEQFVTSFNIVQSDLALLRTAELAYDTGNTEEAKKSLHAFEEVWPNAQKNSAINKRLQALHSLN